ncbi:MAG: serine hydrolase [Planctomycetes bacterium]|nr:serine hydrolase [Planctomycetota bacterium]
MRHLLPILVAAMTVPALPAQDLRELVSPTRQYFFELADEAGIAAWIQSGHRVADVEVLSASPLRFSVTFIEETGPYVEFDWFYPNLDATGLTNALNFHNARLIDLEPYEQNGQLRFAAVMIANIGAQSAPWSYLFQTTTSGIQNHLNANFQDRPWDIDSYSFGGTTYYSAIFIRSTGVWSRSWSWWVNVPLAFLEQQNAQFGNRPLDLERRENGNYDAILIQDPAPAPRWEMRIGVTAGEVIPFLFQRAVRLTDLDGYLVNGQRRYDLVGIANLDPRSAAVFEQARPLSDGMLGFFLKRIGGAELAYLNRGVAFEPASALKVLHHLHAMRQVQFGVVSLATPLNVYSGYSGTCPQDTGPALFPLTNVLRGMMEASDNARTQAVTAYFGGNAIQSTALAVGMTSTALNHRIGCAGEALSNPNRTTLADLGLLHEAVATGWLGSQREAFYEHMNESLLTCGVEGVIDAEGAALGLTPGQIASFKSAMRYVAKDGYYYLIDGAGTHMYTCSFGYLRVPRLSGSSLQFDELVVGAFVDNGSNPNTVDLARNRAVQELLRPELRAGLQTFDVDGGAFAFGTSCNLFLWTLGAPRLGSTMQVALGTTPSTPVLLSIGFSNASWLGIPLPLSLAPFGSQPGCAVLCSVDTTLAGASSGTGQAQIPIAHPNDFAFLGLQYYAQYYALEQPRFRSSNGLRVVIGL